MREVRVRRRTGCDEPTIVQGLPCLDEPGIDGTGVQEGIEELSIERRSPRCTRFERDAEHSRKVMGDAGIVSIRGNLDCCGEVVGRLGRDFEIDVEEVRFFRVDVVDVHPSRAADRYAPRSERGRSAGRTGSFDTIQA